MKPRYILLSLPLLLAACSSNDEPATVEATNGEPVEIRLSASMLKVQGPGSRAFEVDPTELAEGTNLAIRVEKSDDNTVLYTVTGTVNADGSVTTSETMIFPLNRDKVNIYAFVGSKSFDEYASPTISTAQKTAANYTASDVLYASLSGISPTNNPLTLQFSHKTSKLNIVVNKGSFTSAISAVQIESACVSATFDYHTATFDFTDGTYGTVAATTLESPEKNEVMLLPQTLSAGRFIRVKLVDSSSFLFSLPSSVELQSGCEYTSCFRHFLEPNF